MGVSISYMDESSKNMGVSIRYMDESPQNMGVSIRNMGESSQNMANLHEIWASRKKYGKGIEG